MLPALGSRIRLRETIGPFERRTSEQANGCTGQYHGMEWNGTEWQECYKISAFTVSARYSFTQTDSSTTPRCTLLLSVSFVLDVRCHRRHNIIARPLAIFKIVFMRSIYRHFIVNRDRSFSGIVLDHLFYSWRSMIIVDIIIVIWSRTFVVVGILMAMQVISRLRF